MSLFPRTYDQNTLGTVFLTTIVTWDSYPCLSAVFFYRLHDVSHFVLTFPATDLFSTDSSMTHDRSKTPKCRGQVKSCKGRVNYQRPDYTSFRRRCLTRIQRLSPISVQICNRRVYSCSYPFSQVWSLLCGVSIFRRILHRRWSLPTPVSSHELSPVRDEPIRVLPSRFLGIVWPNVGWKTDPTFPWNLRSWRTLSSRKCCLHSLAQHSQGTCANSVYLCRCQGQHTSFSPSCLACLDGQLPSVRDQPVAEMSYMKVENLLRPMTDPSQINHNVLSKHSHSSIWRIRLFYHQIFQGHNYRFSSSSCWLPRLSWTLPVFRRHLSSSSSEQIHEGFPHQRCSWGWWWSLGRYGRFRYWGPCWR